MIMTFILLSSFDSMDPSIGQMLTNVALLAILVVFALLVLITGLGLVGLVFSVRRRGGLS